MGRTVVDVEQRLARVLNAVRRRMPVTAAYVYGSYARGDAAEGSDIDVAVFSPAIEGLSIWEIVRLEIAIRNEVGRDVDLWLYSDRKLEEAKDDPASFVAHILKTGKRIA